MQQVLKGYRRGSLRKDVRSPITPAILSQICGVTSLVCYSNYEASLFTSVFSLAFFGVFRISEILSFSRASSLGILLANILANILVIFRNFSKTDPLGVRAWVQLKRCPNSSICPVAAMQAYLEIRLSISTL